MTWTTCLFLLLQRPPPSSTLFPYTTLFRSRGRGPRLPSKLEHARGQGFPKVVDRHPGFGHAPRHHHAPQRRSQLDDLDRKSTRLNSSHGYISYAVFCLKKKIKSNVHK